MSLIVTISVAKEDKPLLIFEKFSKLHITFFTGTICSSSRNIKTKLEKILCQSSRFQQYSFTTHICTGDDAGRGFYNNINRLKNLSLFCKISCTSMLKSPVNFVLVFDTIGLLNFLQIKKSAFAIK